MRGAEESDKNVRAFARSNEGGPGVVGDLAFTNDRCRSLKRIPVMDVCRGLR